MSKKSKPIPGPMAQHVEHQLLHDRVLQLKEKSQRSQQVVSAVRVKLQSEREKVSRVEDEIAQAQDLDMADAETLRQVMEQRVKLEPVATHAASNAYHTSNELSETAQELENNREITKQKMLNLYSELESAGNSKSLAESEMLEAFDNAVSAKRAITVRLKAYMRSEPYEI